MSDSKQHEPEVNGGLILALSILGLLLCGPLTIVSWIMANGALRTLVNHPHSGQRGLAKAGQIISIIGIVLWILIIGAKMSARQSTTPRYSRSTSSIGGQPVHSVRGRIYVNGRPADPSTPEGSLALHLQAEQGKK